MAIRMGYWDCPGCEKKRIPGPTRGCPECGRPRDTSVPFYTDDAAPEVTDAALLARAKSGADWVCPYCSADNAATNNACVGCGAVNDGAEQRATRVIPDAQNAPAPPPKKPPEKKSGAGIKVLLVLALIVTGVWLLFFRTKPLTVEVEKATWVKEVHLEKLETVREEAWANDVPSGARERSRTTKARTEKVQDGTKKVKVGTKDLGNGLFEDVYEDRPNYVERQVQGTWVSYEIDRWVKGRTLKKESSDGTEPPYPDVSLAAKERERGRESRLLFTLRSDDGKTYEYSMNASNTKSSPYAVGQRYTAMVNAVGSVLELKK